MKKNNSLVGKSVLVTGGCGFIGSHICEQLVTQGAHITILDNLSSGSLDNINHIRDSVTFIQGDITNTHDCLTATKGIHSIFHLAACISAPDSLNNPLSCYTTNVTGTLNILEAARQNKIQRVVFSSSAAVYGPSDQPCHELMMCNPQSPYGYSKVMGEKLCEQYTRNYGINTISLRYFNVYGPRQNPSGPYAGAMAQFNYKMAHNMPITICGDGLQTRDFIPVEQVAKANIQCALLSPKDLNGQAINIATGKAVTLLQTIESLKRKYPNYTQELTFAPERPGDIQHSSACIDTYQKLINSI